MNKKIQISFDKETYYELDGSIDKYSRVLKFVLPFERIEEVYKFNPGKLFLDPEKINCYKNIYVIDENGTEYSCLNCILGFDRYEDPLIVYSASIDYVMENVISDNKKIDIDNMIITTSMPKKYMPYIGNLEFKYKRFKKIYINRYVDNNKVIIKYSISSSKKVKYSELSDILYSLMELTFLYFGDIPKIEKICAHADKEVNIYFANAPKYMQRSNIYKSANNGILAFVEAKCINKDVLDSFIKFRKNTKILFDLLMIHMNGDGYLEITNSMLIQLLEGMYKTNNPGTKKEMREILEDYFINNSTIKTLLVRRDKVNAGDQHNTSIFLYKAKEHRNCLSHLNMNETKKVFYDVENNYAYWKLCLALRIYIMQCINVEINQSGFNNIKTSIESWAKKRRFKYKK